MITIHYPRKIIFGNGSLSRLVDELTAIGSRKVIFVTIAPVWNTLTDVVKELKAQGVEMQVHDSTAREPYFSDLDAMIDQFRDFGADTVVGAGGGSVLDLAKMLAASLGNPQPFRDFVGNGLLSGRALNLVCLPATSGTGSEVSPNAILVDDADGQKKGFISPYLVPDLVLTDPALTFSLPPAITAATGMDALTHCLEAFTNKFAHPLIDNYALEGIRLIRRSIVQAVQNGTDAQAREDLAMGSMLGGFCLGPVNTAAVHALSYPLGSMYHLPHGLSNALLLPYVMEYNMEATPERHAVLAEALGGSTPEDGVRIVRELIQACGLPARLREVQVREETLEQMADEAMLIQRLLKNNPREVTRADALAIFRRAY